MVKSLTCLKQVLSHDKKRISPSLSLGVEVIVIFLSGLEKILLFFFCKRVVLCIDR